MSRGRAFRGTVGVAALLVAAPAVAQLPVPEPQPDTRPAPARIAYEVGDEVSSEIRTVNADGSDMRRLPVDGHAESAAWSPDGSSIAFVRRVGEGRRQIWVMNADGGDQRPYAPAAPRNSFDSSPAWSPDGKSIAFVRETSGRDSEVSRIIVTGPNGAGLRTVVRIETVEPSSLNAPAWSPDGMTIAYARVLLTEESYEPSVYSAPAQGGMPRRLVSNGDHPSWSPDGQRIVFTSLRDSDGKRCGTEDCAGDLYVMNADGSARTQLTSGRSNDRDPDWSPGGERIAFDSNRNYPAGGHPELYSIKADGSCLTWLTNGTADSTAPDWSPTAGSTDPGGCGAVPRDPLIETDTSAFERAKSPVYWLGTATDDGLMVSGVYSYGGPEVFVDYDDCSRFDPSECPPPIALASDWICGRLPLYRAGYHPASVRRAGDALLWEEPGRDGLPPQLYAGPTTVDISAEGRPVDSVVGALRPVDGSAPPGALPRAQLPVRYLRQIERAAAARRKYGTTAATKRLRISRRTLKQRVAIHRRLVELGGVGRVACTR